MRRVFREAGILSIENDPNTPQTAEANPADVQAAEAGEELAVGVLEMTESEVEGQDRVDQIEEGGEIVEALESLAVMAHDAVRGQGFSRETAQVFGNYFEHLRTRARDTSPSKMPSLESFGATTSRIRGTNLSLEEVGDMLKRTWKAIVEKVKAAFKWVRDHFLKVFGNAERLLKRAEALETKIENLKGKPEQGAKVENEALVKKLYVGQEVKVDASANLNTVVSEFLTHAFGLTGKLETAIEEGLKSATGGSTFVPKDIGLPTTGFSDATVADSYKEIAQNNNTQVAGSAELPGGQVIVAIAPKAGTQGAEALKALASTRALIDTAKGSKAPSKSELATLDRAQMTKICNDIKALAQSLVQSRKSVDDVNKKRESLEKQLDSFAREFEKATDALKPGGTAQNPVGNAVTADDQKKNASAAKSLAMKLPTIIDYGVGSVTAYAINTGSAYLDWVGHSIRNFKED